MKPDKPVFRIFGAQPFAFRAEEKVHERKIAEKEVMEVEKEAERKGKTMFSVNEIFLITESMCKNIDINNITKK